MKNKIPKGYIREFYSRTIPFVRNSVGVKDDDVILRKFKSVRVAITGSKEILKTYNGQQMLYMVANLLSRFCLSIDILIPEGIKPIITIPWSNNRELSSSLKEFSLAINPKINIRKDYKGGEI